MAIPFRKSFADGIKSFFIRRPSIDLAERGTYPTPGRNQALILECFQADFRAPESNTSSAGQTAWFKLAFPTLVVQLAIKYSKAMKREDIIRDIHGLDTEMARLEEQYGLLSDDFYHFYRAGELEQTRDFIRWAGFYEAKQERETSYRQLIYEHLRELRRRSGLGALALDPAGA
jgi:hypothetical protein